MNNIVKLNLQAFIMIESQDTICRCKESNMLEIKAIKIQKYDKKKNIDISQK